MRPAICYVRVSTDDQAEQGASLDAQRAQLTAYCVAHQYELIDIVADEGISGKRADNRPGLQSALREVCRRRGVLVVTKLDRLARSTADAIEIAARIKRCKADLAILDLRVDTASPMGEFVFTLMAALGQLERRQIADRTRATMGYLRKTGVRISRYEPYGWRFVGNALEAIPAEQEIIDSITRLASQGVSLRVIAAWLNDRGISAKRGGPWGRSSIQGVLSRAAKMDLHGTTMQIEP